MSAPGPFRTVEFRGAPLQLPVYLDHHATTPLDPRVLDAMLPYFTERFGNPHSAQHAHGWAAEQAVDAARAQVAALIGALPEEIVFTSGATEANNLAIRGAVRAGDRRHVVTCVTEHPCVLETCRALRGDGFDVTELPVRADGLIDLEEVRSALRPDTALVAIMTANHEIGVLQPLAEIAMLCRERGILLHTDAAQAAGQIPLDVAALGVDLMSLSAHKLYGPKGIGALYVRRGVRLLPLFAGGGQERGLRPGTLPTALCVGFGQACALAQAELAGEAARVRALRDRLYEGLRQALPDLRLNGAAAAAPAEQPEPLPARGRRRGSPGRAARARARHRRGVRLGHAGAVTRIARARPVRRGHPGLAPDRARPHHHGRRGRVRD